MPDEGTTGWEDIVRGRIDFPNEKLEDVVLLRTDGRPTYNFASPLDDLDDGITHVIRGEDHIPNTPKQIRILEALGATLPRYAHVPNVLGEDGKKLSKRHGAVSVEEFRSQGYLPEAIVNYLALLGWSLDAESTIIPPAELVKGFDIDRIGNSAATFDYAKLEWMNGVYLRELPPGEYEERLVAYLREAGFDGRRGDCPRRRAARAGEDRDARSVPRVRRVPLRARSRRTRPSSTAPAPILADAQEVLAATEPFTAEPIEAALRGLAERLELKPRNAFGPLRLAVTGSKISPGLFESMELLGRDETLARLSAAAAEL